MKKYIQLLIKSRRASLPIGVSSGDSFKKFSKQTRENLGQKSKQSPLGHGAENSTMLYIFSL